MEIFNSLEEVTKSSKGIFTFTIYLDKEKKENFNEDKTNHNDKSEINRKKWELKRKKLRNLLMCPTDIKVFTLYPSEMMLAKEYRT
jgi:hypothetical protein